MRVQSNLLTLSLIFQRVLVRGRFYVLHDAHDVKRRSLRGNLRRRRALLLALFRLFHRFLHEHLRLDDFRQRSADFNERIFRRVRSNLRARLPLQHLLILSLLSDDVRAISPAIELDGERLLLRSRLGRRRSLRRRHRQPLHRRARLLPFRRTESFVNILHARFTVDRFVILHRRVNEISRGIRLCLLPRTLFRRRARARRAFRPHHRVQPRALRVLGVSRALLERWTPSSIDARRLSTHRATAERPATLGTAEDVERRRVRARGVLRRLGVGHGRRRRARASLARRAMTTRATMNA